MEIEHIMKVKCVEEGYGLTVNKVYSVYSDIDKYLVDDNGEERDVDILSTLGVVRELKESKKEVVTNDPVNSPSHYKVLDDVEAIDLIRKSLTPEQWKGYCLGNIMKYRLRAGEKDALEQDINKANKYKELYNES